MTYEDMHVNKIEEMDLVRFTITIPRSDIEDEVVKELRALDYPEETIRMVGLLGHLTAEYGYHYKADLLEILLYSMQASIGLDESDAQRFRQALEAAIREHHDCAGAIAA